MIGDTFADKSLLVCTDIEVGALSQGGHRFGHNLAWKVLQSSLHHIRYTDPLIIPNHLLSYFKIEPVARFGGFQA